MRVYLVQFALTTKNVCHELVIAAGEDVEESNAGKNSMKALLVKAE